MKISVLITTYNSEKYIADCIRSVENQSYKDFEILVYNDGSTDSTSKVLDKFKNTCTVIINNKKNEGAVKGRMLLSTFAKGEVVCFLGGDDRLRYDALQKVADKYKDENTKATYGNWSDMQTGIENQIGYYSPEVFLEKSFRRSGWKATALQTFKKELVLSIPKEALLDEDGEYYKNCTDLAIAFPILEQLNENELGVIEDCIYIYRREHDNTTLARLGKANKTRIRERLKKRI